MGYDVYCCICGNSCKSVDLEYLEYIFEDNLKEKKEIIKKTKWCTKSFTLLSNNKIRKNTSMNSCEDNLPSKEDYFYGIFIHTDCWKFIKINYGIELTYAHLPVNYIDINRKIPNAPPIIGVNYGEIKKYWSQDMNIESMYKDKLLYMLDSPLITSNKKNISRIKKIISQFKLKKELRPSPPISATFYKNNTIKIGNNNKFWIIKNGKWNEIKENIVIKKEIYIYKNKLLQKNENIPRIGEYNNIPLFINKIKPNRKDILIEFIGTIETIETIES